MTNSFPETCKQLRVNKELKYIFLLSSVSPELNQYLKQKIDNPAPTANLTLEIKKSEMYGESLNIRF